MIIHKQNICNVVYKVYIKKYRKKLTNETQALEQT